MRQWRRASVAALLLASAGCHPGRDDTLPQQITVEESVVDLSAAFTRAAVVAEPPSDPVRTGPVQPGEPLRGAGQRIAIVAPPGAQVRFDAAVPANAVLRFAAGVDGAKVRAERAGVIFQVLVDGREVWRRSVNPAAARSDRQWFDGRVPLGAAARTARVEFRTQPDGDGQIAGTPGWSRVRIVRETTAARQRARPEAPNLLVLLVDTCRADRIGVYGAVPSPSPTLDAFARTGVWFRNSVSQASWTLPSVASIMTGLHPHSHGAVFNRPDEIGEGEVGSEYLNDRLDTWAELAARAGVSTIGVSSNPLVSTGSNLSQGFERFTEFGWDPKARQWATADEINAVFLHWLDAHPGLRFAAYLHFMEPHEPYTPPADLRPPVPPGIRPAVAAGSIHEIANKVNWANEGQLSATELDFVRRLYDAEITGWDRAFAALLAALDARGLRATTTIVVTSDHGEEFQEHGNLQHGSHLYQESIGVPLVIVGPGIPPGAREDLAQGIDLFPTVAARLGIAAPASLPGRDLLAGPRDGLAVSETACGIAPDGKSISLVAGRRGDWKRIEAPRLGRVEAFDLASDPAEQQSRPDAPPSAALGADLAHWRTVVPPPPPTTGHDPALQDKLRALGYLRAP